MSRAFGPVLLVSDDLAGERQSRIEAQVRNGDLASQRFRAPQCADAAPLT
jgi:hypothetical protein